MGKWADYCIVGVHFAADRKSLETVRILPNTGDLLETGLIMARQQIVGALQRGMTFSTALQNHGQLSYSQGRAVGIVAVDGVGYLRVDGSPIAADYLGDLPEF